MDDLAVMIMSMDAVHLGGIGLAAIGCVGLMAYAVFKSKSSKNELDDPTLVMEQVNDTGIQFTEPVVANITEPSPTISPTKAASHIESSTNSLVVQHESSTLKLLESALEYEKSQNRDEALSLVVEAIEQEMNPKEKVRLDVIYREYVNKKGTLSDLISRYPSFLNKGRGDSNKNDEVDLFAVPSVPVIHGISAEQQAEIEELAKQAAEVDAQRASDDDDDTQNFLKEFGNLAQQIHDESKQDKKQSFSKNNHEPEIHDVWANYMSLGGGKMNLKNTFIHLENNWGTISSIAELQEKINLEIGKDHHGNQIPWAIISVLPLKENL